MTLSHAITLRLIVFAMLSATVLVLIRDGGGGLLLLLVLLIARLVRRRWPGAGDTHGSASFADAEEARAAGMTDTPGLHLGELYDPAPQPLSRAVVDLFTAPLSRSISAIENLWVASGAPPAPVRLWASSFAHASIFAASRSGKGASVLITTMLTYPGPILCLDPKGENYRAVRAARQAFFGRRVYCIDSYRIVHPDGGDCYNPMAEIAADDPFVPDFSKDLAAALVVRTGQEKERFFPDASEHLLQTIIAAVLWGGEAADRSIVTVADIIANDKLLANSLNSLQHTDAYGGVLRTLGHQASQLEGREKASVLSAIAAQYLGWLNSQPVRDTVRKSTFDPLWLKTRAADLFICIPPDKLRSASGFSRYLLTGILRRLAQGPPDESRPVLVILDEAASLGQLQVLEDAVTLMAGWGLKFLFVWQAIGQLQDSFPGDKARTFLANMSVQIFGKTNDLETAKHISERIGDATVLATSVQEGGSSSVSASGESQQRSTQRGTSWSVTRNETGRRLLKPEEILTLPAEIMTVFTDRTKPLLVRQRRYYEPGFWDFTRRGNSRTTLTALALFLLFLALVVIYQRRELPPPAPALPPYTSNPGAGRPVGGDSYRPRGSTNDGKEDRRRLRERVVPPGPR